MIISEKQIIRLIELFEYALDYNFINDEKEEAILLLKSIKNQ